MEAAEELGRTFLPCVLVGLSRAPDLCSASEPWRPQELAIDQVGAVVAPAGALGGETVLACADRGIPIVAVSSNPSLLQVDASALDLPVVKAQDYAAAAGLVQEGSPPLAAALANAQFAGQVVGMHIANADARWLCSEQPSHG